MASKARVRQHRNPFAFRDPVAVPKWGEVFEDLERPMVVDVGSAHGDFLLALAEQQPQTNFVGLEIREAMVDLVRRKAERAGLSNVHLVLCNANFSWAELFPPASLRAVFVNFPDPWFKKRHHKRRVIKTPLLDDLARILIEGGEFHFATDFEAYAEEALELIGRHPAYGEPTRCEAPFGILSDREAWHRSQDDPIYRYLFRVHGSRLPREESAGATARAGDDRPADAVDAEPPR